jgi:hypothetical protein
MGLGAWRKRQRKRKRFLNRGVFKLMGAITKKGNLNGLPFLVLVARGLA